MEAAIFRDGLGVSGVNRWQVDTVGGESAVLRRIHRFWSEDEKHRTVAQNYAPGVSGSQVARRFDVNANLILKWRLAIPATSLQLATMQRRPSFRSIVTSRGWRLMS